MVREIVSKGAVRTSALDYFGTSEPFAFVCNRAMDERPWTPRRLRRIGRKKSKSLVCVVALVAATNLDSLMEIVEEWNAVKVRVLLAFPTHVDLPEGGSGEDGLAFGVPVPECYEAAPGGGYTATAAFRACVAKLFEDDTQVQVES